MEKYAEGYKEALEKAVANVQAKFKRVTPWHRRLYSTNFYYIPREISMVFEVKIGCTSEQGSKTELELLETVVSLLDYVRTFDGDWKADWEDMTQEKFTVYLGHTYSTWYTESTFGAELLGVVYMSEACAKGLVDKLNSGEVIL